MKTRKGGCIILKKLLENMNKTYLDYIDTSKEYIKKAPEGRLSLQRNKGHIYYYQKYIDDTGNVNKSYINKKEYETAQALAQKNYYIHVAEFLERKLNAIRDVQNYLETDIDDLYDNLPEERKNLVIPIKPTVKQKIETWQKDPVIQYDEYPETLRFHTRRGELVRSKSELMIADLLYKNRDVLDYRYEQELILIDNKLEVILHPDFKIINLKTGQITYWEHLGRMDDIRYVNGFMKKVNLYSSNGLIIGKDVIMTFEDSYHPLDSLQINQALDAILTL